MRSSWIYLCVFLGSLKQAQVPDNAKRVGKRKGGGGGQNLTRRPPAENSFRPPSPLDDRRITHLICARLKYDPYDFLGGVLGLLLVLLLV